MKSIYHPPSSIIAVFLLCAFAFQAFAAVTNDAAISRPAVTPSSIANPPSSLQLNWIAPPIYIPVFSSTNLLATNWTRITNLYPVWPTNCIVPVAATPSQFFRIGIQSGTNLFSWNSMTATN